MLFEDQGGTRGYNHNAATTKTGEDSEAEGVRTMARNKGCSAPQTNLNSPTSNYFASALAPAPARKIPTVDPWPPDPGEVGATMGHSFPPDPGGAGDTATAQRRPRPARVLRRRGPGRWRGKYNTKNKFKLAHFQRLCPRTGAHSRSQDRHCEPLAPRPIAVDNDEEKHTSIAPTPLAMGGSP